MRRYLKVAVGPVGLLHRACSWDSVYLPLYGLGLPKFVVWAKSQLLRTLPGGLWGQVRAT